MYAIRLQFLVGVFIRSNTTDWSNCTPQTISDDQLVYESVVAKDDLRAFHSNANANKVLLVKVNATNPVGVNSSDVHRPKLADIGTLCSSIHLKIVGDEKMYLTITHITLSFQ